MASALAPQINCLADWSPADASAQAVRQTKPVLQVQQAVELAAQRPFPVKVQFHQTGNHHCWPPPALPADQRDHLHLNQTALHLPPDQKSSAQMQLLPV